MTQDDFRCEREEGHGISAVVYYGFDIRTNEEVAIKQLRFKRLSGRKLDAFQREVVILATAQHPCLVKFVGATDVHPFSIITEWMGGGTLYQELRRHRRLNATQLTIVAIDIARGMRFLHGLHIIHRDLKPDNVLKFKDGRTVLADFSVSVQLENDDQMFEDTDGTPAYYAPEECLGEPYRGKPADVWAFGMMVYMMIYGKFPYLESIEDTVFHAQFMKIARKIVNEEYPYPDSVPISGDLRDFFSHVLEKDPARRYTIEQILQHPWLRDVPDFSNEARVRL
jgi:serine/threonine protein kinase